MAPFQCSCCPNFPISFLYVSLLTVDWRAHMLLCRKWGQVAGMDLIGQEPSWLLHSSGDSDVFFMMRNGLLSSWRGFPYCLSATTTHTFFFQSGLNVICLFLRGRDSKTAGQLESETLHRFWGCHHIDVWVQNRCLFKHLCIVEVVQLVQSGSVHFSCM